MGVFLKKVHQEFPRHFLGHFALLKRGVRSGVNTFDVDELVGSIVHLRRDPAQSVLDGGDIPKGDLPLDCVHPELQVADVHLLNLAGCVQDERSPERSALRIHLNLVE